MGYDQWSSIVKFLKITFEKFAYRQSISGSLYMKNRYSSRSKISEKKLLEVVRLFAMDLTVLQIATLVRLNRNTVSRYVIALRKRIAEKSQYRDDTQIGSEDMRVEPVLGVRGRNPSDKHAIVLLFESDGKILIQLVPRNFSALMQAVMRGKVRADGVMEGLSIEGCKAIGNLNTKNIFHLPSASDQGRVNSNLPIATPVHRFWTYLKDRMRKIRGIRRTMLPLHLCECEFRFNNRDNIFKQLIEMIEAKPLF